MKRLYYVAVLIFITLYSASAGDQRISRFNRLTNSWASYPEATIQWIQEVHQDSLIIADSLQNSIPSRWVLQRSPHNGDTVVVTAVCVVPAKILTFTNRGWSMLLYDTAYAGTWKGLFARASSDTASHQLDGFLNVESGDIIKMTGVISDFPTNSMNSATQFQPIPGIAVEILTQTSLPTNISKNVYDFYTGIFPGGKVKYTTGEPYEGMLVQLTNLTLNAKVNTGRGTFSMVDVSGNEITMYDASKFFTLKGTSLDHPAADPIWTTMYANASVGTQVDTIRGYITTVSGSEGPRGYRIAPIFYGDVKFGVVRPGLSTHRRYPVVVRVDSTPLVTVRATQLTGGAVIDSVTLNWSIDNGPFTQTLMSYDAADSLHKATIPSQPAGTFIHYFIKARDVADNEAIYANAGSGSSSSDTSQGFFFYTVLDHEPTIADIQNTPYRNGRSAYVGEVVSVTGVVTADTAHIGITALNTGGTSSWYLQVGNAPWSGMWVVGPESTMARMQNGNAYTVTGSVSENFDVTRVQFATSVVDYLPPVIIPSPVTLPTSTFGPTVGNGTPSAEQWEGMLVTFNNVTVTDVYPVFSDITEFEVDDGSGPVIVRRDGKNNFSNVAGDTTIGKTILKQGDRISSLTGVMYYSFNRYKIVPRTNADFGTVTGVLNPVEQGIPSGFALSNNYPNPFNPTTQFDVTLLFASHVDVTVYNMLGQNVRTLVNEDRTSGTYTLLWDGNNNAGNVLPSGVYLVRMNVGSTAGSFSSVRKVVLMK